MNIKYDAKTNEVTVTFKYVAGKSYPASKSGKTAMVATTAGFVMVPGIDCKVSLNATTTKTEE